MAGAERRLGRRRLLDPGGRGAVYILVSIAFLLGRRRFLPIWLGLTVFAFLLGAPPWAAPARCSPCA